MPDRETYQFRSRAGYGLGLWIEKVEDPFALGILDELGIA